MPHHHLYYHMVWTTKDRLPLITPALEPKVHRFIAMKVKELKGRVLALDGIEDHVHLVCTMPATIALATFVGKVMGASSRLTGLIEPFGWQAEYGSYTVSRRDLPKVIEYVRNQKRHHAEGTTIPMLERSSSEQRKSKGDPLPGEPGDESPGLG